MTTSPPEPTRPALRIVRGTPSPEELAVLTALLSASGPAASGPAASGPSGPSGPGGDAPTRTPRGRWADPAHGLRRPLRCGPGAWAASARG